MSVFRGLTLKILPRVRVHSWGGFGSQLFAMIIAERLIAKKGLRQIMIVFHTSGVTERELEIPKSWLDRFRIKQVADYHPQSLRNSEPRRKALFVVMRERLKVILSLIGFTSTSNSEEEFLELRPWVLSIRGHYTRIHLTEREIHELMMKFGLSNTAQSIKEAAIHYRLGDLITSESKEIITPNRIIQAWKEGMTTELPLKIFSDSTRQDFEGVWQEVQGPANYEFYSLSPIQTIQSCFKVQEFLGTNAKLSLWVAVLRSGISTKKTLIPNEIRLQVETLLQNQPHRKSYLSY